MGTLGDYLPSLRWFYLRRIRDPRERRIEHARLFRMKSPLTFAERKARRVAGIAKPHR